MPSRVHFACLVVLPNLGVGESFASICNIPANLGVMNETSSPRDQLCLVALTPTTCVANAESATFMFTVLPQLLEGMETRISIG